ncbi:MAG: GNAT family N-acetyltransferase [Clostridia bacterium]|nr:GNAT family N-acetyltransferase [Clostridia bacterium]
MKIRPIEIKDNAQMAKIIRDNFESYDLVIPGTAYFDPQLDTLAQYYETNGKYFVLVDDDDKVHGGCGLGPFKDIPCCVELQKLYIDDSVKGKGYGRKLAQVIEEEAKRQGYERVYIETHSKLDKALILYDRLGYVKMEKPDFVQHSAMDTFLIKEI